MFWRICMIVLHTYLGIASIVILAGLVTGLKGLWGSVELSWIYFLHIIAIFVVMGVFWPVLFFGVGGVLLKIWMEDYFRFGYRSAPIQIPSNSRHIESESNTQVY